MEAFWLGSASNSEEEASSKTKKLNDLFSVIDPDYGKQSNRFEQKARFMELMSLGIDVEVVEGVVIK